MKVAFNDMLNAFDYVSFGAPDEHQAFLDKSTGTFYWHSDFDDQADELPGDIYSDRYIVIPHKDDLDLGRHLVLDFVDRHLPDDADHVRAMFRSRGAYRRYKHLLEERELLEQWYAFEAEAREEALRAWCKENAIELDG